MNFSDVLIQALSTISNCGFSMYSSRIRDVRSPYSHFMDIHVDAEVFEVPVFALSTLREYAGEILDGKVSLIAVNLLPGTMLSSYKTAEPMLKKVMSDSYVYERLRRMRVQNRLYYGTKGAVFFNDFTPVFTFSWLFRKANSLLCPVKPILRIRPSAYIERDDMIQSFTANKLIRETLSLRLCLGCPSPYFKYMESSVPVELIIGESPFSVHEVSEPSISTTDEELRELTLKYSCDLS